LVSVILDLDLERGAHVKPPVEALVVPRPHIFEGGKFDLLNCSPRSSAANELGFVEPVDGLGEGVDAPNYSATRF
jgi:hypothetical protein